MRVGFVQPEVRCLMQAFKSPARKIDKQTSFQRKSIVSAQANIVAKS